MANDNRFSIARTDETPFRHGGPNRSASFGDLLVKGLLETDITSESIADHIAAIVCDELELIGEACTGEPPLAMIRGALQRCAYMLRLAPELAVRIDEAEGKKPDAGREDNGVFLIAPWRDDIDAADFGRMRRAKSEDFRRAGWVSLHEARETGLLDEDEPADSGTHPVAPIASEAVHS